jgi:hypothetical protein
MNDFECNSMNDFYINIERTRDLNVKDYNEGWVPLGE